MARRIKEEPGVHRSRIAMAAGKLFEAKGIKTTTMDEIAKEAGYSKATLYVYFQNKEEIVGYLVLHWIISMLILSIPIVRNRRRKPSGWERKLIRS